MSIFGLLSCIVDLGIFYWFNRKYTMKDPKRIRGMASFFVIVTVLLAENYFQVKSLVFLTIINFCFYAIIFSLVYYEKKMIIRTFEILLGVMIGEILVSLVTMALTMRYEWEMILEATGGMWIVIYTCAKICECFILNIINKITDLKNREEVGKIVIWSIVFWGSVLTGLYLYLGNIISSGGKPKMEWMFFLQLLIMGLILFSYLNIMSRYYRINYEKMELETLFDKVKKEADYYEQTNALHEEIRKIKHDLKNFLILGDDVEIKYLKDIDEYFGRFDNYVNSGNRILDLLIMNKAKVCKEKGINFNYQFAAQYINQLNALDTISVFGNLVDNAIEACEKLSQKEIKLRTWEDKGILFVEMTNPIAEIIVQHSRFLTTKKDKKSHGLGLLCVEEAVKRYDGTCKISIEEGQFEISICIPAMQSVQLNTKSV